MRWGVFAVVLLAICVVQPAFLATLTIPVFGQVNLFLVLALVCGFLAPQRQAPQAGWIAGLLMDLCGSGALGAYAVALALAALAISRLREWLNADTWWVQILICIVVGSGAEAVAVGLNGVHDRLWYAVSPAWSSELAAGIRASFPAALLVTSFLQGRALFAPGRHPLSYYGRRA